MHVINPYGANNNYAYSAHMGGIIHKELYAEDALYDPADKISSNKPDLKSNGGIIVDLD